MCYLGLQCLNVIWNPIFYILCHVSYANSFLVTDKILSYVFTI